MISKTHFIAALMGLSFLLAQPPGVRADAHALVVIELFTSEGCSSCPPADEYLSDLADEKGLLPLSMHVDYWDYIGWKDPFASADITRRQRAYGRQMNTRHVYTPQMVVQGRWEGVGSDRRKIKRLIKMAKKAADKKPPIPVSLTFADADKKNLLVRIPKNAKTPQTPVTLYLVTFERERVVKVKRGENRGETLTHRNVVRSLTPIGRWKDSGFEATITAPNVPTIKTDRPDTAPPRNAAVLVQDEKTHAIIGAGVLSLKN